MLVRPIILKEDTMDCSSKYRSLNPNRGTFKKGFKPWNKGVVGYSIKGHVVLEEVRKCISKSLKGRLNTGASKRVYQVDKNSDEVINNFPSAKEAQRQTGISSSAITNNTNNYSKSAGGYKWVKGV